MPPPLSPEAGESPLNKFLLVELNFLMMGCVGNKKKEIRVRGLLSLNIKGLMTMGISSHLHLNLPGLDRHLRRPR